VFGSSLTSGAIENYAVAGNVFVRQDTDIGADFITVEPRGGVYDRIVMSNNAMRGGTVLFGGTNWSLVVLDQHHLETSYFQTML
jgi:polygalacturonase